MAKEGRVIPDLWMENATGQSGRAGSLIGSDKECLGRGSTQWNVVPASCGCPEGKRPRPQRARIRLERARLRPRLCTAAIRTRR